LQGDYAITEVAPNGPAAKASLRVGDVITVFDGTSFHARSIAYLIAQRRAGDTVAVELVRGRLGITATVTLGSWPQ
jgi:S1-C subfamily serine protease